MTFLVPAAEDVTEWYDGRYPIPLHCTAARFAVRPILHCTCCPAAIAIACRAWRHIDTTVTLQHTGLRVHLATVNTMLRAWPRRTPAYTTTPLFGVSDKRALHLFVPLAVSSTI